MNKDIRGLLLAALMGVDRMLSFGLAFGTIGAAAWAAIRAAETLRPAMLAAG